MRLLQPLLDALPDYAVLLLPLQQVLRAQQGCLVVEKK